MLFGSLEEPKSLCTLSSIQDREKPEKNRAQKFKKSQVFEKFPREFFKILKNFPKENFQIFLKIFKKIFKKKIIFLKISGYLPM